MSEATHGDSPKNRRRKKLIRMDLQLKIVFITLFVASLVLLINFQLTLAGLWNMSSEVSATSNVDDILNFVRSSTIQKFLFSVAMAVPLAGFVGVLYSFKFCGPIYKFKKYFSELPTERWDERCMLRQGDDLQDVCDSINIAIDGFRERVREDHRILQDVKAFLDRAVFTMDTRTQDLLTKLRSGIEAEESFFRERFPSDHEAALTDATSSKGETREQATVSHGGTNEENVPSATSSDESHTAPCAEVDLERDEDRELEAQA